MTNKKTIIVPVEVEDYYPKVAVRLLNRILKAAPKNVVLFGFVAKNGFMCLFRVNICVLANPGGRPERLQAPA